MPGTGRAQTAATSGVLNIRIGKTGGYGWFGGGITPTPVATVDRINFANDSVTASPRGPLSATKYSLAATGNSNYGWFGGGRNPALTPSLLSSVDRINFSNDSVSASPRGLLSSARYRHAATGNSNYGWFGGGQLPAVTATVDRIDFSNDSVQASSRGPLSSPPRTQLAATGNSNYGWFGGGGSEINSPAPFSTIDRIDFSNDSATASVRGILSQARYSPMVTGNSNYGWFCGGGISDPEVATVDRIDFSNDSVSALPRGVLSANGRNGAATGNNSYGWIHIGYRPYTRSIVNRIDFSNDSATVSVRGSLSLGRVFEEATSNTSR